MASIVNPPSLHIDSLPKCHSPPVLSKPMASSSPEVSTRERAIAARSPPNHHHDPIPSQDIDMETFRQILDLDEDDTCEFSRGMAWAYFAQASNTFLEMDEALTNEDLAKLSSLGHFLKGSSAALGVSKVQASCEKIQHYGLLRDEDAGADLSHEEAVAKIGRLLGEVKEEYKVAERWLRNWYESDDRRRAEEP